MTTLVRRLCAVVIKLRTARGLAVPALTVGAVFAFTGSAAQAAFLPTGSFGGSGSGNGQFGRAAPIGIAVDQTSGDVYVSDTLDQRVEQFDSQGNFLSQFGSAGSGSGQFTDITGVAVDQASGDVYVADIGDNRVERFDSSGNFVSMISGGVDQTTGGNVCTASSGDTCGAGTSGSGSGQLAGGFSWLGDVLAVNGAGDLFVADTGNGRVEEFDSQGNYLSQITTNLTHPVSVAVGPTGSLYVADTDAGAVQEYDSSGNFIASIAAGTAPQAVATNAAGDLFVFETSPNPQVVEFDPTGATQIDAFGSGTVSATFVHEGIAVGEQLNAVYVAQANTNNILIYRTPIAPAVSDEHVTNVTADSAQPGATVNPDGADTTVHIDYGTTTSYGQHTAESASIGSDFNTHQVSGLLQGLSPSTTYHWRLVATNPQGTTDGPDRTFTTQTSGSGSFSLPDGRGYELVTPADQGGGQLPDPPNSQALAIQGSPDGNGLAWGSILPFPGAQSGALNNYVARRGSGGWSSISLIPPQATQTGTAQYPAITSVSSDLSRWTLMDGVPDGQDSPPLVPGEPANQTNLFLGDGSGWQLLNLVSGAGVDYEGASADLSTVVFGDAFTGSNLYEWHAGADTPVAQVPPGSATRCGAGGPACVTPSAAVVGAGDQGLLNGGFLHAVSADGSDIVFTASVGPNEVFMRQNGSQTVAVSASRKTNGTGPGGTDPDGPANKTYWWATPDGSNVLFTSCEQLTNDATAVNTGQTCPGPTGAGYTQEGNDLYSWDRASGGLSDLTVDHNPSDPSGADVQGVLGASDDGSYVYFVANGALAPGASLGNCVADQSGACNVYLWHAGTTTFIGRVPASDGADWNTHQGGVKGQITARVSPDGRYLAFDSTASLTGYDNLVSGGGGDSCGTAVWLNGAARLGPECTEVYRYDAARTQLQCLSCNPTGASPVGASGLAGSVDNPDQQVSDSSSGFYLPRALSSDGQRLFFDSYDALLPQAGNGHLNVYEWEADGSGGCQSAAESGGCLYLLSTGASGANSYFVDASADGGDVFIQTVESLVPQDTNTASDIYDVRVGGGFPYSPPVPCSGDNCRPPAPGSFQVPVAATASFFGPGNQSPSAPPAKPTVLTRTVRGARFVVRVKVAGPGRITISGAGIRTVAKSVATAGTYPLTVTLTAKARKLLARKHKLTLGFRVRYAAPGSGAQTATVRMTVLPAAHRTPRRARRATNTTRRAGR